MKKSTIKRILALVLTAFAVFAALPGICVSSEDAENNIKPDVATYYEWNRLYEYSQLKKGSGCKLAIVYCRDDKDVPVQLVCVDGKVQFAPLSDGFNYVKSAYSNKDEQKFITTGEGNYLEIYYDTEEIDYIYSDLTSLNEDYSISFDFLDSRRCLFKTTKLPKRAFYDKFESVSPDWTFLKNKATFRPIRDYEFGIAHYFSGDHFYISNVFAEDYVGEANVQRIIKDSGSKYGYPMLIRYYLPEAGADAYSSSARVWYATEGYITRYTGEKYVVTSDAILHLDDFTLIDEGTELIIEPDAVVTVSGRLINNGTITNYGTLILEENASVFSETQKGGMGSITCKGVDTKYYKTVNKNDGKGGIKKVKVTLSGEGTVIINDNAKLSLKKDAFLSLEKGTTCYNNGYLIIGGGITMNSASLINDGAVSIGYYEKNQSNFEKRGLPVALDGYGYIRGVSDDYSTNFNAQSNYSGAENYVETGEGWYDVSKKIGDSNTVFYDGD